MAYLTLSNISKQFGDSYAVQDFNLDVEKGEFVSFLGPSGCGKTTTLRMVAGFETPTDGTIRLDGSDITVPQYDSGSEYRFWLARAEGQQVGD
jgi:putative spermidine/putrescine transport system ATP-binding protein